MENDEATIAECKSLLSCLSDGELSDQETQDLLQTINGNAAIKGELKKYWARIQLSHQLIHRQVDFPINDGLSLNRIESINNALDSTAEVKTSAGSVLAFPINDSQPANKKESLSAFKNLAIAASVMFVVSFGWLGSQSSVQKSVLAWFNPEKQFVQVANAKSEVQSSELAKSGVNNTGVQSSIDTRFQPKDSILVGLNSTSQAANSQNKKQNDLYLSEHRIEDYMLLHAEHASLNTNQGMMPFARISKVTKSNQF